ncbi:MAG: sensor histidine kinase [Solirubrobacteraceae bacterium]
MRTLPRSLRARIVTAAVLAILSSLVLFGGATVVLVGRHLRSSLDSSLRQRALDVAELAVSAPAVLSDPGALESPVSGRTFAVEVLDAQGRILARSLALGANLLPLDRLGRRALRRGETGFEDTKIDGRPFRLYAAPVADAGGVAAGGAVLVASDPGDISDTLSHLGLVVVLGGAVVAVLAALAAAALTRRGLEPLTRLAAAAAEIERTADPSQRLPEARTADEIAALTGVLNRMLASLEQAGTAERRFLADASHELRTPVTSLRGNVEYVARHGFDPEALADLQRDAARLAHLVDDLLVLERQGESAAEFIEVSLDALVRATVSQHEIGRDRLQIGRLDDVRIRADPAALARALENLIENALVHGPPGATVLIELGVSHERVRLSVQDEGPGVDPALRSRMFERFWRGPDASGRPGAGLGLAIVAAIAARHGGEVKVSGSCFALTLPRSEPAAGSSARAGLAR